MPKFLEVTNKQAALAAVGIKDYYVDNYGADPTGVAFSDSAVAAAMAEMGSNPGTLIFGRGNYRLQSTITLGPYQSVVGGGRAETFIRYSGNGDCIRMQDPAPYVSALAYFPPTGTAGPRFGGRVQHVSIYGTGSGADACAIHVGDMTRPVITDVNIWNFEGANAKGVWFDNRVTWTEKAFAEVSFQYCTTAVVFQDNNPYGPGSFPDSSKSYAYSHFKFYIVSKCNQSGVRITDVNLVNLGEFNITGNFFNNTSATTNTGIVLYVANGRLEAPASILVEASGEPGWPGHRTIVVEDGGNIRMSGHFYFMGTPPGTPGIPFQDGSDPFGNVCLTGVIDIDGVFGRRGAAQNISRTRGSITGSPGFMTPTGQWFPLFGNWVSTTLAVGNHTVTVPETYGWLGQPGVTPDKLRQSATWELFLRQPASGGSATLTWPENFLWASGSPPDLRDTPNAYDHIRITTTNFQTFYGEHVNPRVLKSPRINEVLDTLGNSTLEVQATAGSINKMRVSAATSGSGPRITALGNDTNVPFSILTKGTGRFLVRQGDGTTAFEVIPIANAVNHVQASSAVDGNSPSVSVAGQNDNINLRLLSKGTGTVQANGNPVVTRKYETITTSKTVDSGVDHIVLIGASGAPTLPTAVDNTGVIYTFKNIDTVNRTISTTSSQTIEGLTTYTLPAGASIAVTSDNSNYRII